MSTNEPDAPVKVIRLNYLTDAATGPTISLVGGDESSLRLALEENKFLAVSGDGVAISPGMGNNVTVQGMSTNMIYGGMLQDLPFPMALIPTTPVSPFPKQLIRLPFLGQMAAMVQSFAVAAAFTGI